jgi:hypothetical protein
LAQLVAFSLKGALVGEFIRSRTLSIPAAMAENTHRFSAFLMAGTSV